MHACIQAGEHDPTPCMHAHPPHARMQVRRKDWLESMIHHIATVALLVYSYHVNFTRVGVMIILVHDSSDIFLEAAKLAR